DADIGAGHVVNTVPPRWFEAARLPLYHEVETRTGPDALFGLVRKASYEYLRELWPGEAVEVRTAVRHIGTTSVLFYQEAWQRGQLAVTAETLLVMISRTERRKQAFSPASRAFLAPLLESPCARGGGRRMTASPGSAAESKTAAGTANTFPWASML